MIFLVTYLIPTHTTGLGMEAGYAPPYMPVGVYPEALVIIIIEMYKGLITSHWRILARYTGLCSTLYLS